VTTRSNTAIADLHDRMPVVLDPDAWATWLGGAATDPAELHGLLVPNEAVELDIYPVSRAVNDARADGPALLEPLAG
jgi:putative SOS response-associated peptidase YedK